MKNNIYILFVSLFFYCSIGKAQNKDIIPAHDNFTIDSKIVKEKRVINVWIPPSYIQGKDSLPVLYMPDGGVKEDFPHIANTLAKLIKNKKIPPFILVGIENTERRRDLSGHSNVKQDTVCCPITDGAIYFRGFILNELIPTINSKYRTKNIKGIIGESLAGLFVMEIFLTMPNEFDLYIAMDPSLWWNNHQLVRKSETHLEKFPNKEIRLWFAGSSSGNMSIYTKKLAKSLKENAPKNLIWKYSDEPSERHSTIFRATKEKALIWILKEK